jgi:hypothetical protein
VVIRLTTVARQLTIYKLDLFGVYEVRWDKVGRKRAGDYIFLMEKERKIKWEPNILYTTE